MSKISTINMPAPDVALRSYFEDDEIFASVFNSFLFEKNEYINPKSLKRYKNEYVESIKSDGRNKKISRYRDIVRRTDAGCLVVLGIEDQSKIHYAMPIRKMLYDALEYVSQTDEQRADNSEMRAWTADERLSKVKKGTKLLPVITVVFYTGETKWDGPRSLYDMIDTDDAIRKVLPDQPLHIIDLGHDENLSFTNEDLEELRIIVSDIYASKLDRDTLVDSKNLSMAGILVGDKELYISSQNKEGRKPMCNALKERDAIIFAEKDAEISEKDAEIMSIKTEKDAEISKKDEEISRLKALLEKNNIAVDNL